MSSANMPGGEGGAAGVAYCVAGAAAAIAKGAVMAGGGAAKAGNTSWAAPCPKNGFKGSSTGDRAAGSTQGSPIKA